MSDIFIKILKIISEQRISFFSILVEVTTIWGFVYTLPNFFKQMNAANTSATAGQALALLPQLKIEIINLLYSKKDEDRDEIIKCLITLLSQLNGFLKLLPFPVLCLKTEENLAILMKHDNYCNDAMIDFLKNVFGDNWRDLKNKDKSEIPNPYVIYLEETLKKVYRNPMANSIIFPILRNLIILTIISVTVYLIKFFILNPKSFEKLLMTSKLILKQMLQISIGVVQKSFCNLIMIGIGVGNFG